MSHLTAVEGPFSFFADQPFPPLLEGINEPLPFLIRSPSRHHHTPPSSLPTPRASSKALCSHTIPVWRMCERPTASHTQISKKKKKKQPFPVKIHVSHCRCGLCLAVFFVFFFDLSVDVTYKPTAYCGEHASLYWHLTTAWDASSLSYERSGHEGTHHSGAMLIVLPIHNNQQY